MARTASHLASQEFSLNSKLHAALENALRWNLIVKNVCNFVTPPVPRHNDIQPLTPEQVRCLLEAAHGDKLEAVKLSQHRVAPACSMWFDCTGGGENAAQRCVSSADGFGPASDRR